MPGIRLTRSTARWTTLAVAVTLGAAVSSEPVDPAGDIHAHLSKLEKLGFAGVVVVARDGVPILARGYGMADRERGLRWTPATVSTIGSITKQFTAAAVLALEEQGHLRVEDPLAKHFADVPDDKRAITLHQLLTHSSGIVDLEDLGDSDPIGRDEFVRRALAQPLAFAPGSSYEYSNANYSLLGAIVEQTTGASWEQFVRTRLLLPLGMYETGYVAPQWGDARLAQGYRAGKRWGTVLERPMAPDGPYWGLRANGGVHATAYDMVRWAQALLDGRVLSSASRQKLWTPYVKEPGNTHYGYGWSITKIGDTKIVSHNGGNGILFADLGIVSATGTVVFLQSNVIAETPVANRLLEHIGARMLADRPLPEVPDVTPVDLTALRAFEGTYRLPGDMGALRFAASDGRLLAEAEGQLAFAVLHSSRPLDTARVARLSALMDRVVGAAVRGDYVPMQQARGDDVPVGRLSDRYGAWLTEQRQALGESLGYEVLGTALQDGRDVTVVRFRFAQGHADRAFVWDPDAETRLQGVSFRGLRPTLPFYPTGIDRFGSWDGGLSPSKPAFFRQDAEGRMRVTLGQDASELTGVR